MAFDNISAGSLPEDLVFSRKIHLDGNDEDSRETNMSEVTQPYIFKQDENTDIEMQQTVLEEKEKAERLEDWATCLQTIRARTNEIFYFSRDIHMVKSDWVWFRNISHGGGFHRLCIRYSSNTNAPIRIRINNFIYPNAVAEEVTTKEEEMVKSLTSIQSQESMAFREKILFNLGPADKAVSIGMQPIFKSEKNETLMPNIVSFFFEKIYDLNDDVFLDNNMDKSNLQSTTSDSYRSPFVFNFDVGNIGRYSDERYVDATSFALRGSKPITFRSGECNDDMTVGSRRIGSREGGRAFPSITFVDDADRIDSMTLGMSTYAGEKVGANFCAAIGTMSFENTITGDSREVEGLSASFRNDVGVWEYKRKELGLDLWLTSAYHMKGLSGSKSKQIFRYGFALSKSEDIPFSISSFEIFWEWFVRAKYFSINFDIVGEDQHLVHVKSDVPIDLNGVEQKMKPLHDFLVQVFSGYNCLGGDTGFIRGTKTHLTITHDEFCIYVKLVPDKDCNERIVSALFIDGVHYDPEDSSFDDLGTNPQYITAYALYSTLQDLDILFEMGLLESHDSVLGEERELLPQKKGGAYGLGGFKQTKEATRALHFLTLAGLRKVAIDEAMTDDRLWDIYDLASATKSVWNIETITAFFCMIIQILGPIALAARAFYTGEEEEIHIVVYLCRLAFGIYAVFYEVKLQNESAEKERLVLFLSMIPEFSSYQLLIGLLINVLSKICLSVAIIILLWFSYSVIDVTLNALALYFILEIDDYLVSSSNLEKFRKQQQDLFFQMKYVLSRDYYKRDLAEPESWAEENWSKFSVIINIIHRASLIVIVAGVFLLIILPITSRKLGSI